MLKRHTAFIVAAVTLCVMAFYAGHRIGYSTGNKDGYAVGYEDNVFEHHGCSTPEKAGDTIDCYRYPMFGGRNKNGLPPIKIVVDQDLFDRWVRARDDKEEPSSGIDCRINKIGVVDDCMFPVG